MHSESWQNNSEIRKSKETCNLKKCYETSSKFAIESMFIVTCNFPPSTTLKIQQSKQATSTLMILQYVQQLHWKFATFFFHRQTHCTIITKSNVSCNLQEDHQGNWTLQAYNWCLLLKSGVGELQLCMELNNGKNPPNVVEWYGD